MVCGICNAPRCEYVGVVLRARKAGKEAVADDGESEHVEWEERKATASREWPRGITMIKTDRPACLPLLPICRCYFLECVCVRGCVQCGAAL
jgi:hypothetical protein